MKKERDRITKSRNQLIFYWCVVAILLGAGVGIIFLSLYAGIAVCCFGGLLAAIATAYTVLEVRLLVAFRDMADAEECPFAFLNEYGHLELLCGEQADAEKYVAFSIKTFQRGYRVVDGNKIPKPTAEKGEKKRVQKEEKELLKKFSRAQQFNDCTATDLMALRHKTVYVSKRMFSVTAGKGTWEAVARNGNTVHLLEGNFWKK